ncbi:hypothetical protein E2P81_ATG11798 [Venturia nashicola]|nr:hypothetical protein E2P81_ATG11798 [Venturia nashicola]
MFNLPLQLPVSGPAIDPKTVITHVNGIITHGTGLSDEVQKITSVPAVGNHQIITLLNTLVCKPTFEVFRLTFRPTLGGVKPDVQALRDDVGILNRGFQQLEQRTGNVEEQMGQLNTHMATLSSKVDDCDGELNRVAGRMKNADDQHKPHRGGWNIPSGGQRHCSIDPAEGRVSD